MLRDKLPDGKNVAILPVPSKVTVPATLGATVKVVVLMVGAYICSLKVAVIMVSGHTPLAPLGGETDVTMGGGGGVHEAAAVLKVHTKLLANALPKRSLTPVVMVAV